MSDETAFLLAIRNDPSDDTARLVYADWLDENNRPERAQFIRAQIEANSLGEPDTQETRALFKSHWREWFGHLIKSDPIAFSASVIPQYRHPSILSYQIGTFGFESWTPNANHETDYYCWWLVQRGFISVVRGTFKHWSNFSRELIQDQPVTEVILSTIQFPSCTPDMLSWSETECRHRWPSVRVWKTSTDDFRFWASRP